MKNRFLGWLLFCSLILLSELAGAAITVSVDRNPVNLNESFQLNFESDKSVDSDPDFSALRLHFTILNSSQSSNISIVNGNYQRSIKWALQLMPKQTGAFIVPAIRFDDVKSRPFEVKVNPPRQSTGPGGDGLTIELIADRSSLYVQSQAIVTLRLMTDTNISDYQIGDMNFNGMDVVAEPLGDITQYQTKIGDRAYLVLEKKYALFPQQSGDLTIEPVRAVMQLGSRTRSLFDPFQNNGQIVQLLSKSLTLEVLTRADAFNAQHWLPSTGIQLTESWQGDLDQLSAGVPITRTITMTAEGLTAAQLPKLGQGDIQGINQYPDKPTFKDQRSSAGIVGKRQQKIALVATTGGRYTIPEISIPWWNLETDQLEFATIPSRSIQVLGGAASEADPVTHSKSGSASMEPAVSSSSNQTNYFWIWLSLFLAAGWILSILAWWIIRNREKQQVSIRISTTEISLSKASRRLRRACARNNALETRDAILAWANALKPDQDFVNLNQVTHYFDQPFKQQIDDLNQSLYSQTANEWDGDPLWLCCEQLIASTKSSLTSSDSAHLMPLNP